MLKVMQSGAQIINFTSRISLNIDAALICAGIVVFEQSILVFEQTPTTIYSIPMENKG